jgi:hypothetical protein
VAWTLTSWFSRPLWWKSCLLRCGQGSAWGACRTRCAALCWGWTTWSPRGPSCQLNSFFASIYF